jgi:hypothetical protein
MRRAGTPAGKPRDEGGGDNDLLFGLHMWQVAAIAGVGVVLLFLLV